MKPVAEVPGKVAQEAARGTNWTLVAIVALFLVTAYAGLKLFLRQRAGGSRVLGLDGRRHEQ